MGEYTYIFFLKIRICPHTTKHLERELGMQKLHSEVQFVAFDNEYRGKRSAEHFQDYTSAQE